MTDPDTETESVPALTDNEEEQEDGVPPQIVAAEYGESKYSEVLTRVDIWDQRAGQQIVRWKDSQWHFELLRWDQQF